VPELLERIIKLQQPARIERIKEELRGERRPEQKFHAQIISLRGRLLIWEPSVKSRQVKRSLMLARAEQARKSKARRVPC
jgi:hypothetical protein